MFFIQSSSFCLILFCIFAFSCKPFFFVQTSFFSAFIISDPLLSSKCFTTSLFLADYIHFWLHYHYDHHTTPILAQCPVSWVETNFGPKPVPILNFLPQCTVNDSYMDWDNVNFWCRYNPCLNPVFFPHYWPILDSNLFQSWEARPNLPSHNVLSVAALRCTHVEYWHRHKLLVQLVSGLEAKLGAMMTSVTIDLIMVGWLDIDRLSGWLIGWLDGWLVRSKSKRWNDDSVTNNLLMLVLGLYGCKVDRLVGWLKAKGRQSGRRWSTK